MGKYWFTADEHYGHTNIIEYCNRPFTSVEEMNTTLIENHNSLVCGGDCTVHIGDFSLSDARCTLDIIAQLNGSHIFIRGSHDAWLKGAPHITAKQIWRRKVHGQMIVCCHYALRVWPMSHYGAWHLYGHSHGLLHGEHGKSFDVGVDNWDFKPLSFTRVAELMNVLPENDNLVGMRG
jgi:calcineurin-like phosphoesterase family protein